MSDRVSVKRIITKEHLEEFLNSDAYKEYIHYIERLNDSVKNLKIEDDVEISKNTEKILQVLDVLISWIKEIPPEENSKSRFGNPAFRIFYDRVVNSITTLFDGLVPDVNILEVSAYFCESFGNQTRIDYGTGHEANFICWLYIELMRNLQFEYWLEPAGSHGVWGLDDYHFLPFLFGSAQLLDHKYIKPKSIHDHDVVEQFQGSYMYLACIHFINSVKTTASLRWHSPMLDDISACKVWTKVNQGMIKMYKAEVLGKLPIMQHFMFGSLISFDGGEVQENFDSNCGHNHSQEIKTTENQEYPECCGIPVPSAIAAAASSGRRSLPFD